MKKTIALLLGGKSNEREVSLKTGEQIYNALDKEKYNVIKYDPQDDLQHLFNDILGEKIDLVFPALHGANGEDGRLQGMLDILEIPYVFSGCLPSALAMDKYKTKLVAEKADIPVAENIIINRGDDVNMEDIIKKLQFPIVIKPINSGSSVGISIARSKEELSTGIKDATRHDDQVMLEEFIEGRELTVAVMEHNGKLEALPVIEIIPKNSTWFDYQAKYEAGASDEICPANIPNEIRDQVQTQAVQIFKNVGCKDLARADFIWNSDDNNIYFLEINTIPGMTATSLAPQAAAAAGMNFPEFLDKLIENNL